jgi:ankyrin repeat protein
MKDFRDQTPLHVLCKNHKITADVLQLMLLQASQAGTMKDSDGFTPLHYLCRNVEALNMNMINVYLTSVPAAASVETNVR